MAKKRMTVEFPAERYIAHVDFAISLSQMALNTLTAGAWVEIKDKLYEFLSDELIWSFASRAQPFTTDDFVVLSRVIGASTLIDDMDNVVDDPEELWGALPTTRRVWRRTVSRSDVMVFQDAFASCLTAMQPGSDFREDTECTDLFYFDHWEFARYLPDRQIARLAASRLHFYILASGIGEDRIRVCPTCNLKFLAKRKPIKDKDTHCSPRCAQNAATKAYRRRNRDVLREKERKRSKTVSS